MTQHLLLKSFTPASGAAQEVGTINVFIGPNNSGKSEALRDIARLAGNFEPSGEERASGEEPKTRVIHDVTFVSKLSMDRLLRGITILDTSTEEGKVAQGLGPDLSSPYRRTISAELKNVLFRPIITARSVWTTSLGEIMPLRVAYLPVEQHRKLIEPASPTSPLRAPETLLAALHYADASIHEKLAQAMTTIFDGEQVFLDTSERVQLSLRIGNNPPASTSDPIQDAMANMRFRLLHREGGGMVHVAAIVLTVLLCPGRVILLDQPDEGLQPEVSRRLAAWIAENAASNGCQVFAVSRDPSFLIGLFAGATDVSIWRVSRRDANTRFDLVPSECGRAFAAFPLFTSQQAIRCLFQEGVIATPASSDAVVYQAVAERMVRVHNVGFLQAQGSRNLTFVVKALRRANIPTCVVAELDLFQNETTFTELVKALTNNPPPSPWLATRERLVNHVEGHFDEKELSATSHEVENFLDQIKQGTEKTEVKTVLNPALTAKAKWDRLRRERLAVLPPELRIWIEELLEDLKRIGLFVSPKGRIEGWINFAADDEDPDGWLNRAMQFIHGGECPADLRAFVAEMTAQLQATASGRRPG